MNSENHVIRRGSKHDIEMLDIDDVYINGKAGYEDHDKGLTAAERYLNKGVVPDDLHGQGLSDIMELVPPGNTEKPAAFRFLDLPREIRDYVWTPGGLFFHIKLGRIPISDLYRYTSSS